MADAALDDPDAISLPGLLSSVRTSHPTSVVASLSDSGMLADHGSSLFFSFFFLFFFLFFLLQLSGPLPSQTLPTCGGGSHSTLPQA
jgi:hypothetical protein